MGKTANQRLKEQRQARTQAGWVEVRVWVPSKDDALKVQEFAGKLRSRILNKQALEQLIGVKQMNEEIRSRILNALENQGSEDYVTPSGAFLELLTELAKTGQLADMSAAYQIFVDAYPSNANFVASSVPAKVLNHFFIPSLGLNGASHFLQWTKANLEWANELAESLPTVQFQQTVNRMLLSMKQTRH